MSILSLVPFTEHWASIYKPIQHDVTTSRKKNKRFFCIESIAQIANFAKELPNASSPFVAIETNIGGDIGSKFLAPEYNVYFFVLAKQKVQDNDREDAAAKEEAMRHAVAYLNYIRREQHIHSNDRQSSLMGIDTENVRFETFGPMMNRWFCVGLAFTGIAQYSRCVNENDYLE